MSEQQRFCFVLLLLLLLEHANLLDAFSHHLSAQVLSNVIGNKKPQRTSRKENLLIAGASDESSVTTTRQSFLSSFISSLIISTTCKGAEAIDIQGSVSPPAVVTHTVSFNVRISRRDGTFYVRDGDDPSDTVFTGRILVELFGALAPTHVSEFLKYVNVANDTELEDSPLPNYGRSMFTRLDQATGLLEGGVVPGLEVIQIGGSAALKYGGRILSAPLWIEKGAASAKISHGSAVGLVTHRLLDLLPTFGITTRKSSDLDATHFVFGRVKPDETSLTFLKKCADLPTYSIDRRIQADNAVVDNVAGTIYASQKDFFRNAAKSFGDSRLDKVYEGKLLRRVDITKVELI